MREGLVDLESLRDVARSFVLNLVVPQVEVRQDQRVQHVLRDLARARVGDLVVREVELRDGLVEHQPLHKDRNQVVVDQVAGQREVGQLLRLLQLALQHFRLRHLHAKQRSFVIHVHVLCAVCERQVSQVDEMFEHHVHLDFLKLRNHQTENLVLGRDQLLFQFFFRSLCFGILELLLNPEFYEGLFVTPAVHMCLHVFNPVLPTFWVSTGFFLLLSTLLFPVKLKVDVLSSRRDRQIR